MPGARLDWRRTEGSVDREAGERPARARHCDRAKPAARHAAATGREAGKARREARKPGDLPPIRKRRSPSRKGAKACARPSRRSRRRPSHPSLSPHPWSQAAPTEVNVRIEGRGETLFEGPILTEGHNVRAASDTKAPPAGRRCNGLNNGENPTPGPTPTAASVDAMSIARRGLRRRSGTRSRSRTTSSPAGARTGRTKAQASTGALVVNNVFTNVGGCQYQLDGGDEVLWVYDAFSGQAAAGALPGRLLRRRPGR